MKKIGVLLSGCGVMDGSEIHESVLTLLAIAKRGAQAVCMAPNVEQADVINHLTQQPMKEKRNVLAESARIARGVIKDLGDVKVQEIDALILPGGYGAAKNLCTFAVEGENCKVHPAAAQFIREVRAAGKPIGAICISPAVIAKIFEGEKINLTIGNDPETSQAVHRMGQSHIICKVNETCVDSGAKMVTTPAYMLAENIAEAWEGIDRLVGDVMKLMV